MQDPSNLAVRLSSPPNTATKVVSVEDSKTSKVANSASSRMAKVESKVAKVANPAYNKKVKLHGEGAEAGKLIYSAPDIKVKQISDTNLKMSRSEKLEPRKVSKQSAGKTDNKVTDLQSKEGQQNYGTVREHPKTGELFDDDHEALRDEGRSISSRMAKMEMLLEEGTIEKNINNDSLKKESSESLSLSSFQSYDDSDADPDYIQEGTQMDESSESDEEFDATDRRDKREVSGQSANSNQQKTENVVFLATVGDSSIEPGVKSSGLARTCQTCGKRYTNLGAFATHMKA